MKRIADYAVGMNSENFLVCPIDEQIVHVTQRLSVLNDERGKLAVLLEQLQKQKQSQPVQIQSRPVNIDPVTTERIRLFMSLFRGREDMFPKRWDNPRTGKSGYAPACRNEWVKNVCNKPRIPCGVCTNQAFLPVSEDTIRKHLCGDNTSWGQKDYTIGVYARLGYTVKAMAGQNHA